MKSVDRGSHVQVSEQLPSLNAKIRQAGLACRCSEGFVEFSKDASAEFSMQCYGKV